jgi:hypothetical protein
MSGRGLPSPPVLYPRAPSSPGRFRRDHYYGVDFQRPQSKITPFGRKQPTICVIGRKQLYIAFGRKPIFSVEKSIDFAITVENRYSVMMSGLASCRILWLLELRLHHSGTAETHQDEKLPVLTGVPVASTLRTQRVRLTAPASTSPARRRSLIACSLKTLKHMQTDCLT